MQRYMEPLSSAGTRSSTSSFPANSALPSRRRLPTRVHVNSGSGKTSFCWPEQEGLEWAGIPGLLELETLSSHSVGGVRTLRKYNVSFHELQYKLAQTAPTIILHQSQFLRSGGRYHGGHSQGRIAGYTALDLGALPFSSPPQPLLNDQRRLTWNPWTRIRTVSPTRARLGVIIILGPLGATRRRGRSDQRGVSICAYMQVVGFILFFE